MRKIYSLITILAISAGSMGLFAQETTMKIQIKKDGKLVRDTLYEFGSQKEAEQALKMMELHKEMSYAFSTGDSCGEIHEHIMVLNDDDAHVWMEKGKCKKEEKVIVIKKGGDTTYEIITDGDEDIHMEKEVRVEVNEEDGEITITTETDGEVDVKKMKIEDAEEDNIKVIVVKKELDPDEDQDHDEEVEVKVIKKRKMQ